MRAQPQCTAGPPARRTLWASPVAYVTAMYEKVERGGDRLELAASANSSSLCACYRRGFPRPPRIAPGSGLIMVVITPESGWVVLGVDGTGFADIGIMIVRAAAPTKGPRR